MAVITEVAIRELAGVAGKSAPVTSCYLNVDGSQFPRTQEYEHELELALRRVRDQAKGEASVLRDIELIEAHVREGVDRSSVRGLAIFSCSADNFWRVIELPVPVITQVVVNQTPVVRQLERVVDEYERFGVLLVDRQRCRVFVFELGELVEKSELFEELPRQLDDDRGAISKDSAADHSAEMIHQHLRHAADMAFKFYQEVGFDHLIVGAPEEIANEIEADLHPYLKERLAGRLSVRVAASDDEIRLSALVVERGIERASEAKLVERLREAAGANGRGAAGLKETLQALVERRVDHLLVSDGYEAPGWRCPSCQYIGTMGRVCPVCQADMNEVADVVEEAVEDALQQSCKVDICSNADLDVLGGIGALLRY